MSLVIKRKGTEFNTGSTYERYSGENTRGRVTAEGAALGGAAAAAGAGATSLAGAKLAGTPLGQSVLGAAHAKLEASHKLTGKPEHKLAAQQVGRYKKYGEWAGRNKVKTAAGILGATGAATVLRLGQKSRQNEEAGISQGIGRMKAGEHYAGVQRRAVAKAGLSTLALGSDIVTHPKLAPMANKILERRNELTAAGLAGGGVIAGVTVARSGQKHGKEYRKLRGELRPTGKATASKAAPRLKLKEHFGTPSRAVRTVGRNPQHIAAGGVLAGGAAMQHPDFKKPRTRPVDERRKINAGTGAAAGGTAGHLAWIGHTQRLRGESQKLENVVPEGMSRNKRDNIMRAHRKAYGIPHGQNPNREQAKGFYRNYPEELPAAPLKRKLGHMATGKTGIRNQGLAIAAGAVPLAIAGAASTRGRKEKASKADVSKLYVRDQETSLPHLIGAGAGLALGAWGFGRSRMVGAALGRGIKMAQGHQNHTAVAALQQAQALQGILARGTAPGERALRQIRSVDQAVSRVPAALRPEIALAAGTLLVGHSRPIRRESYHPVNIRVRTFGGY